MRKPSEDEMMDSFDAVKEYYELDPRNKNSHFSKVVVKRNGGVVYNNNLEVRVSIQTNDVTVTVYGDQEYDNEFHPTFSNQYQFYSMQGTSLVIKTEDYQKREVDVIISSAI